MAPRRRTTRDARFSEERVGKKSVSRVFNERNEEGRFVRFVTKKRKTKKTQKGPMQFVGVKLNESE